MFLGQTIEPERADLTTNILIHLCFRTFLCPGNDSRIVPLGMQILSGVAIGRPAP